VAAGTKSTISGWPYNNAEFSTALLKLSDLIVETNDRDKLGYATSEILGQVLEVSRVGYAAIEADADTLHTDEGLVCSRRSFACGCP
jgi:hypothetical protein